MTVARLSGVGAALTCFLGVLSALLADAADPDLSAFVTDAVDEGGTKRVGSCARSLVEARRCWMWGRSVWDRSQVSKRFTGGGSWPRSQFDGIFARRRETGTDT